MTNDDFNWRDSEDIIVTEQSAIAAYLNPNNHVVIRQERNWGDDEDMYVVVSPVFALQVAQAILDLAGVSQSRLQIPTNLPKPTPITPRPDGAADLFQIDQPGVDVNNRSKEKDAR